MFKQFPVRYGRNYKVVLAIILPSLAIVPFIFWMQGFKSLEEWKIWLIIFVFLGVIIIMSIWLAMRVYPEAILTINKDEISFSFTAGKLMSPVDFSFNLSDITSFKRHEINGAEYFLFETQNPYRKFQISASTSSVEDLLSFNEAMSIMNESLN